MNAGRPWMRGRNFAEITAPHVTLRPDEPALVAGDLILGFRALDDRAGRFAGLLAARGIGRGDVVALAMGNDWRFVETLLGTLRRGAVALLVNIKLGHETLQYVLGHCDAKLVVTAPEHAERLGAGDPLLIGPEFDAELLRTAPVGIAAVEPDDLALLMYTSGSTGRPKGVMLSHSNTWWQARSAARTMLLDEHDRGLVMGPLYHANALWAILLPMLHVGGTAVVLRDFDPAAALRTIAAHRITFTSGTPSMYALLLAELERTPHDVSSIELLECGSASVPAELLARLVEHFGCEPVETYGLTEGGANVLAPRWGIKKLGSTGLPVPDAEIRVVAPDRPGRECGPGEVGELWTRSPANALGYLHDATTTAERFSGDGWLRTGDLFRRDEQGYCYFCGRTDDMISVGGENVYPKEVEAILAGHAAVRDVAVVAAAHPVKGEAPIAFVVRADGSDATEADVRRYALDHGPAYAHPRRVFFLDALPMNATNKLDRSALERQAADLLPDGLTPGREPTGR